MKAISSAVAAVLIATISITLVGTTYFFSQGVLKGTMAEAFEVIDVFSNKIIVRNIGTQKINNFTVLVDGKGINAKIEQPVEPENIGTVILNLTDVPAGRHELVIMSSSMSQRWTWEFQYVPEATTTTTLETTTTFSESTATEKTEGGGKLITIQTGLGKLLADWAVNSQVNSSTCTEGSPCVYPQYQIITANATVKCSNPGSTCGSITSGIRYNDTGNVMRLIDKTKGATPMYVLEGGDDYYDQYIYSWWNFSTASQITGNPSGIAYNGTHFWVTRYTTPNVYMYNKTGDYISSFSCSGQDSYLQGIDVNETHIFVVGSGDKVYAYNMTGYYTGWSFSTTGSTNPTSVVYNGTYFWVTSTSPYKRVYRYRSDGTYDNWNFDYLIPGKSNALGNGLEFNGTHFFISDIFGGGWVYAYNSTGNYTGWNFTTVAAVPWGLTYSESEKNFYTVDYTDKYVRRFTHNSTLGFFKNGDVKQVNYTINITSDSGVYKIDINFTSDVLENSTNDAIIQAGNLIPSPKYFDNSTSLTIAGQPTEFRLRWNDNLGLSGYIFSTNNTGTWYNTSFTSMTGTDNWSNVTIPYLFPMESSSIGYWKFDEGSGNTTADSSPYQNNGTLKNNSAGYTCGVNGACPSWVSGKFGNALQFDGRGDYVNTTNTTLFTSKPFSVSFWMNPKTVGGNNPPSTGSSTMVVSNSWNWWFEYWNTGSFDFKSCASGCSGASTIINDTNKWYYITGVYNGTHYILYVNGSYVSAGANDVGTASYPILIGSGLCGSGSGCWNGYFNGTIDELRIYNRTLTANEIAAHYAYSFPVNSTVRTKVNWKVYANNTNNNWDTSQEYTFTTKGVPILTINNGIASVNTSSLVGYWRLENETLGTATDYSGYENNGILVNMNNAGDGTSGPTDDSRFGKAMKFDGSNDYINVSHSSSLDISRAVTLVAWIKPDSLSALQIPVAKGVDKNWGYEIWIQPSGGYIGFGIGIEEISGDGRAAMAPVNNYLAVGKWSYIVGTADTSTGNMYLYIDGQKVGETSFPGSINQNTYPLQIGKRYDVDLSFDGTIDEVQVWNRSLSADEIKELYESKVKYMTQTSFSKSDNTNGQITTNFYRNQTPVSSPDIVTLGTGYYYYLVNTSGNENYTQSTFLIPLNVIPVTPPLWRYQGSNNIYVIPKEGDILLHAQGKDDEALDWAMLATNETGQWKNITEGTTLTTFNDSNTAKNITFLAAGSNVSVWVKIPKNANITSAKVNVSGFGVPQTPAYVWHGGCGDTPQSLSPSADNVYSGYRFQPQKNGRITKVCGYFSLQVFPPGPWDVTVDVKIQNSTYNVLVNTSITSSGGMGGGWGCTPINYDVYANQYYYVGAQRRDYYQSHADSPKLCNNVNILETCTQSSVDKFNSGRTCISGYDTPIYGEVDIEFAPFSYPTNPILNLGNNPPNDWSYSGELNNINSPQQTNFNVTKLRQYLSTCTADSQGNCIIPINITSNTIGTVQLNALEIKYYRSPIKMTGDNSWQWSNFTWQNKSILPGTVIGWMIYYNDTNGNENVTGIMTFKIDGNPPQWFDNSTNNTVPGKPTEFRLRWNDNLGLSGYIFSTNNTGTWYNTSFTSMTGTDNWSNVTIPYLFPMESSSIGYWKFDEGSGSSAKDSSNNGNDGELKGPTWIDGRFGKALAFDGVDDVVNITNAVLNPRKNDFTISAWFRTNGSVNNWYTGWQHLIYYQDTNNTMYGRGIHFGLGGKEIWGGETQPHWPGQAICFIYAECTPYCLTLNSSLRYDDGNWHYMVCTIDRDGTGFLYVDGQQVDSKSVSPWSDNDYYSKYNATIGMDIYKNQRFNGTIDEVKVWNRVLTADDIKVQYAYSFPLNNTAGTISWRVYANDTSNNLNVSDVFSFVTSTGGTSCNNPIDFIPCTIDNNNTIYTLAGNLNTINNNGTVFVSGVQNTTLNCLGYNLNGTKTAGTYGVYLTGINTKNNTVKNCNITNFYNGIYLYSGTKNNLITRNIVSNNSYGFYLSSSSSNNITNNNVINSTNSGIYIFSSGETPSTIILNNTITTDNGYGIYFDKNNVYGTTKIFDNNITMNGNSATGIYLHYFQSNEIENISNNIITMNGNSSKGIYGETLYNNKTISNNNIIGHGRNFYGIHLKDVTADILRLSNNNILVIGYQFSNGTDGTYAYGIYIDTNSYGINTLSGNNITIYSKNGYGITLSSSTSNTLSGNNITIQASSSTGISLSSSNNNRIYNNTIKTIGSTDSYGIYTSSSYNNFTQNKVYGSINDVYDSGSGNNYKNNSFIHNIKPKMITIFSENRSVNVNDVVKFNVSVFYSNGTACSNFNFKMETRPVETVNAEKNGNNIIGNFTPSRLGLYSLTVNVSDDYNNSVKRIYSYIVNGTERKSKYFLREINPIHGQPASNAAYDAKSLLFTAPTSTESWNCGVYIQASPDELATVTPAFIKYINISTWYKFGITSDNNIGIEKLVSHTNNMDYSQSFHYEWPSDYLLLETNFTNLNWSIDYPKEWYYLSLKLKGSGPFWKTNSTHPSHINFTYVYTTTPEIKSITNPDVLILSATSPVSNTNRANIILDGIGNTNLTVKMPSSITYDVYFDNQICNNANCNITQSNGEINLSLSLSAEHEVKIQEEGGGLETLIIDSIEVKPIYSPPNYVKPEENSTVNMNVTVNVTNSTSLDKCIVRIFDSHGSYSSPIFGPDAGTIQINNNQVQCFYSWSMGYSRNPGDWNVSVDLNLTTGLKNFTSSVFNYLKIYSSMSNVTFINFTGLPGQTVNSTSAYPMKMKNTGNTKLNISINGSDLIGETDNSKVINVSNVTYNETETGIFKNLTKNYVLVFSFFSPVEEKLLYFRAYIPLGFKTQMYNNTIGIKGEES